MDLLSYKASKNTHQVKLTIYFLKLIDKKKQPAISMLN